MPILHFYDSDTLYESLTLGLDAELHDLLEDRVDYLWDQGLLNMSEIVVIGPDTLQSELIAAVGFDPLVDIAGRGHTDPGFCSAFDHVCKVSDHYYEAIVTVGNSGFAFQFLVHEDASPGLVALCKGTVA